MLDDLDRYVCHVADPRIPRCIVIVGRDDDEPKAGFQLGEERAEGLRCVLPVFLVDDDI